MEIIDTNLNFKPLTKRNSTNKIILHHSASETASPEDIHRWHLNNGWSRCWIPFFGKKRWKDL